MNLLTKTTPWIVASLLATATVFGSNKTATQNNCNPCNPPPSCCKPKPKCCDEERVPIQLMPAYNAPAGIDVRCSWDVYASGSFIYWQMSQDNMGLALVDNLSNASYIGTAVPAQIQGNIVRMDFDYLPGFKVGLGVNFNRDDVDSYAEYTRLHGTNSTSTKGADTASGAAALVFPSWGSAFVQPANVYNTASEHWRTNLDIGDWDLGRVYYVGKCLTFRPSVGVRGAWILQNVHAHYVNTSFSNATAPIEVPGILDVYNRTHSWAVGPRTKLNTNWLFGRGFRFYGNAGGDILYTNYKVQSKTTFLSTATSGTFPAGTNNFFISKERVHTVRTHLDCELGFGWGSYFDNNNWHIDLSASYGFQVFFNQNMMPRFSEDSSPGQELLATGNLYAQGLTANLRLDF